MTMYKAVGWHSKNEYMAGNSLADVMRKLQKEYPAPRRTSWSWVLKISMQNR
ncbi:hypothetical protein [Leuconostoc suionicum]|uniref:hypothetical protein n=1 Tax=Leuconostoc suionicum TaxID=1511761 RepID=UPI00233F5A3E|nr:hypothetical protein [Leuconostoc suionicum]MDC2805134.1 hypothetical protein [Leuconostoc suionicum]MDC2822646.1 hypothetical protein [Leuconostoc suionicum]